MPAIDMTGERYGRLTVIERDYSRPKGTAYWYCKCDCGNTVEVYGTQLKNGKMSCGCILKENKEKRLIEKEKLRTKIQNNKRKQKVQERLIKEKIKLEEKKQKKQDFLKQNSLASRFPNLIKE